jgi:hypothetical protein
MLLLYRSQGFHMALVPTSDLLFSTFSAPTSSQLESIVLDN